MAKDSSIKVKYVLWEYAKEVITTCLSPASWLSWQQPHWFYTNWVCQLEIHEATKYETVYHISISVFWTNWCKLEGSLLWGISENSFSGYRNGPIEQLPHWWKTDRDIKFTQPQVHKSVMKSSIWQYSKRYWWLEVPRISRLLMESTNRHYPIKHRKLDVS